MPKRLPQQVIKVPNYGNDWINRLAVILDTVEKMGPDERSAAFRYMRSKYSAEWPTESY